MQETTQALQTIPKANSFGIALKKPSIFVPSTPASLHIEGDLARRLILNPVAATEILFGLKLDEFQKADLKVAWWTKFVMDSSGVSASKSLRLFIISNLRCILIPEQVALIYYPFFGMGQDIFWNNYEKCARLSPLFSSQIGHLGIEGEKLGKSTNKKSDCWICHFKNGSKLMMPAGGFDRDSMSQAGRRCNFLGIDEFTKIENTGSTGIDDQLMDRNTAACFNQEHPIWTNHYYFLATAEDTMHPAYDRYLMFKREVERGNPMYAMISRSFKDYSNRLIPGKTKTFRQEFRNDLAMLNDRKHRTTAKYLQENLGIWGKSGKGWYTRDLLDAARKIGQDRGVKVMTTADQHPGFDNPRRAPFIKFFCGIDPAKSEERKSADGAIVVLVAEPRVSPPTAEPRDWNVDYVYGYKVRKAEVDQWSGLIHRKHQDFRFSGIAMDHGGGGDWVRGYLKNVKQVIRNKPVEVKPIACIEDEVYVPVEASFILSMFKPKDAKIKKLYEDQTYQHESNLIDFGHQELLTALTKGGIGLPQRHREIAKTDKWYEMSEELQHAAMMVDMMAAQLQRISVKTENDGTTAFNGHHARMFGAKGRKDFAYAGMYGFVAFLCWLKNFEEEMYLLGDSGVNYCGGGGLDGGSAQRSLQPAYAGPAGGQSGLAQFGGLPRGLRVGQH
jgi:hypothetical protein